MAESRRESPAPPTLARVLRRRARLNTVALCMLIPVLGLPACDSDSDTPSDEPVDAAQADGGHDAAAPDAAAADGAQSDLRVEPDRSVPDAGGFDIFVVDAAPADAVRPDARQPDADQPDAAPSDVSRPDVTPDDAARADVPRLVDAASPPPDAAPLPRDAAPSDIASPDAAVPADAARPSDVVSPTDAEPQPDAEPQADARPRPDAAPPACPVDQDCTYRWAASVALEPPDPGRQRCETALTTDAQGRVWLAYLDTEYYQSGSGMWIAWPRDVIVWTSDDQGATFVDRRRISAVDDPDEAEGDESLASDALGNVFAAWVQYTHEPGLIQKIYIQRIGGPEGVAAPIQALPWEAGAAHDQSSIHVGADGTIHLLGRDIGRYAPGQAPGRTLYARSLDHGATYQSQQRLPDLGGNLPQLVSTESGLIIAGPMAYVVSHDNGVSFGPRTARMFATPPGGKLVRLATGPDHRVAYVVSDSDRRGINVQSTDDGGETWRTTRVDDGEPASAWRYPVVHVDADNRVHVIWMDDRSGEGAVYHAYSDDEGQTFSTDNRVSDVDFPFPASAPPPPPATQTGTWIGDYHSITTVNGRVVVAWADQRAGTPQTTVYYAVGQWSAEEE